MKKVISVLLSILLLSGGTAALADAGSPYLWVEDFEEENVLDGYTVKATDQTGAETTECSVSIDKKLTNNALKLSRTKKSSPRMDASARMTLDLPLRADSDKYYIFSVDFESNDAVDYRFLFTLNDGCSYQTRQCLATVMYKNKLLTLCDPDQGEIKPLQINTKYNLTVIYKGNIFFGIYLDGSKLDNVRTNKFPQLPGSLESVGFMQSSWSLVSTWFDNIKIAEAEQLKLSGDSMLYNVPVYGTPFDVKFNNPIESGSAKIVDENNEEIAASTAPGTGGICITPQKALLPDSKYTVVLQNVSDIFGHELSEIPIKITTVTADLYHVDDDFTDNASLEKYQVTQGEKTLTTEKALKIEAAAGAKTVAVRELESSPDNSGRYVAQLDFKTSASDGEIVFFPYGTENNKYLFKASPKAGSEGLYLYAAGAEVSQTRLDTESMTSLAAVFDLAAHTYDIYVNGNKINETAVSLSAQALPARMAFIHQTVDTAAEDIFDNVKYYKLSDYSALKVASCSVGSNKLVSCCTDKITVEFTQPITDESISKIKIYDENASDVQASAAKVSGNAAVVEITLSENLRCNTRYTVVLENTDGIYTKGIGINNVGFITDDRINVTRVQFSGSGISTSGKMETGEITATVKVDNMGYRGEVTGAALMLLYYKGTKLLDVASMSSPALTNQEQTLTATVTVTDAQSDCRVKAYVVDSLGNMFPLVNGVSLAGR